MARPVVAFGDWHGNEYWAVKKLHDSFIRYPEARLVHVGDFGFWDTDIFTQQYMKDAEEKDGVLAPSQPEHFQGYVWEVEKTLAKNDQVLYVVLGNHENYWEIDQTFGYLGFISDELRQYNSPLFLAGSQGPFCTGQERPEDLVTDEDGFIMSEFFPHIRIAPRAHVWEWDGVSYASLGGATSIDVMYRRRGQSWWEQEIPVKEEVAYLESIVDSDVDVLFTHDGPVEATSTLYGHGHKLPPEIQVYAEQSGSMVQRVVESLRPKLNVCGHHHVRKSFVLEGGTHVEILDKEDTKVSENMLDITGKLGEIVGDVK